MSELEYVSQSFTSPMGRGRNALAFRVRGYSVREVEPLTPTLSPWEREFSSALDLP
jgi:hypothetical protein